MIEKKKRSERRLLGGNSLLLLVLLACMMSTAMILRSPPALVKLATMASTLFHYEYSVITEACFCCKETASSVLEHRLFYWLLAETGIRAGELAGLRLSDIDG